MLRGSSKCSDPVQGPNLLWIALIVPLGICAGLVAFFYFGIERTNYTKIDTMTNGEERLEVYSKLVSSVRPGNMSALERVLPAFNLEYSPYFSDGIGSVTTNYVDNVLDIDLKLQLHVTTAALPAIVHWGNVDFSGDSKVLASIRDTFIQATEARCGAGDRLLYSVGDTPLPLIVWAEDVAILCAENRIEIRIGSGIEYLRTGARGSTATEIVQAYGRLGLTEKSPA